MELGPVLCWDWGFHLPPTFVLTYLYLTRNLEKDMIRENDTLGNKMYDDLASKARPFMRYRGKLYIGDEREDHMAMYNRLFGKPSDNNYKYTNDGRIWLKDKVITFWEWPKNFKQEIAAIITLASKVGIRINLNWGIQIKSGSNYEIISIEDYIKSGSTKRSYIPYTKSPEEKLAHLQSPMKKKQRTVTGGSKKHGGMPAYRRNMWKLTEIGDAKLKPFKYTYKRSKTNPMADFTTPSGLKYRIEIIATDDPDVGMAGEVLFGPIGSSQDEPDTDIVTNKGEMFRIIPTVIDFMKKADGDIGFGELVFGGTHKGKTDFGRVSFHQIPASQRTKLYYAFVRKSPYVKKHFDVSLYGNEITLTSKYL